MDGSLSRLMIFGVTLPPDLIVSNLGFQTPLKPPGDGFREALFITPVLKFNDELVLNCDFYLRL